ncbi:hypothetical protein OIU84_009313 [Salix udensis]|uniref:Homeobox domain-containing protein n=1 Tax=Salix udensis TaxID=889485 RepID=A0AAD6NYN4_9ROSI|nr:hypothetical protein OIU84_009313 [Salix udensis]
MATYYTSSNNQRDAAAMVYLPGSYPEAPALPGNIMMYMNSGSYSDNLAGNPHHQNNCIEFQSVENSGSTPQQQEILSNLGGSRIGEHDFGAWRDGRNEMLVMHSVSGASSILHGAQSLQGQGLSLSLGTQIPSGMQMPSIPYRNSNPGLTSFLTPNSSISGEGGGRNGSSRDEQSRNIDYLTPGFSGGNHDVNKGDLSLYGMNSIGRAIPNPKYLKAAQQLLDEVVNVRKAIKQPDKEKNQTMSEYGLNSAKAGDSRSKNGAPNPQESTDSPSELSHAERQELQNKLTKLLSMLDESLGINSLMDVEQLNHTLRSPSRLFHDTFRCLRDAITGQIRAARNNLGEQETSENSKGVGISRLRFVDQQLRQQRALQQLGMMKQHAWRPQRGLPESSVSILRAWLFEHFLHPYPKDSDKIMLARQTGLTRSQVSNWFINARVRLWKPMVEEMYKEELGDAEMDSNSSSENAAKATKGDGTSEEKGEEFQHSASSTATGRCSVGQLMDSKSDHVPEVEMAGSTARNNFHNGIRSETFTEFMAAAAAAYQMPEVGRFGNGSGVSLTLGLQHCEGGSLPMSGTAHHGFVSMRGDDDIYNAASSVGAEPTDFECLNPGNRQQRFSSSHVFHDFVA